MTAFLDVETAGGVADNAAERSTTAADQALAYNIPLEPLALNEAASPASRLLTRHAAAAHQLTSQPADVALEPDGQPIYVPTLTRK
jgi:hypothetical protein